MVELRFGREISPEHILPNAAVIRDLTDEPVRGVRGRVGYEIDPTKEQNPHQVKENGSSR